MAKFEEPPSGPLGKLYTNENPVCDVYGFFFIADYREDDILQAGMSAPIPGAKRKLWSMHIKAEQPPKPTRQALNAGYSITAKGTTLIVEIEEAQRLGEMKDSLEPVWLVQFSTTADASF